jgi:hypothetical protein
VTAASRILARAMDELWDREPSGLNGILFTEMTPDQVMQHLIDVSRELAVMRRAWHYAAPGICAGHIQLGGQNTLDPKPVPEAVI